MDWHRDVLSTDLILDVEGLVGTATIRVAGSLTSEWFSLDVSGLTIESVVGEAGALNYEVHDGRIDIAIPTSEEPASVEIAYTFAGSAAFDGWAPERNNSFLWPTYCGNLYPCKPNPNDGSTFSMSVTGFDEGLTAVYPESIPADAPAYQPAIAIAAYEELQLEPTSNGTQISVWHLPGGMDDAIAGTVNLSAVFDFFEQTYGDYIFGDHVGSVSADWGGGDFGGMEHHPFWHVSSGSMYAEEIHAHEAAHGWFGDGIRIACWEDFTLSEGLATYLAARALSERGVDLWGTYACRLESVCESAQYAPLPDDTCNELDILDNEGNGLWSSAPYQRGAWFLREVAMRLGEDVLDDALAAFYTQNVGEAAQMADLIEHLHGYGDAVVIDALADGWLRSVECPMDPDPWCLSPFEVTSCDPELTCENTVTCVEGNLYPTTCGPDNCDSDNNDPIGLCTVGA